MKRPVTLAIVAVSLALFSVATARPQFPFFNPYVNVPNGNPLQAGVGVQTPVAGVDLSAPHGLTVNRGQQQPVAQPAYQNNIAPFGGFGNIFGAPQDQGLGNRYDGSSYNAQPAQGQGFGNNFNGASYNAQPAQGQGFGNNFNGASYNAQPAQGQGVGNNLNGASYNAQPAQGAGLGTRIDGNGAPYNGQPAQGALPSDESPERHPCQDYDPSLSPGDDPCAGIEGGNKINPKQAALLSLVG